MKAIEGKCAVRMMTACSLVLLLAGASSMAAGRGSDGHRGGNGGFHNRGSGFRVAFWDHGWFLGFNHRHYWGGFSIGMKWFGGPTVVVAGIPYYYYGGCYYVPAGDNLVVAEPPFPQPSAGETQLAEAAAAPQAQPAQQSTAVEDVGDSVIINVPNSSGGFTPVTLVKTDAGYLGPQGEYYPDHPTVAELKVLYGGQ